MLRRVNLVSITKNVVHYWRNILAKHKKDITSLKCLRMIENQGIALARYKQKALLKPKGDEIRGTTWPYFNIDSAKSKVVYFGSTILHGMSKQHFISWVVWVSGLCQKDGKKQWLPMDNTWNTFFRRKFTIFVKKRRSVESRLLKINRLLSIFKFIR